MYYMKSTMTLSESFNISPINDKFISYFWLLEYTDTSINYIYPETEDIVHHLSHKYCHIEFSYTNSVDWWKTVYMEFWENFLPFPEYKHRIDYDIYKSPMDQTDDIKQKLVNIAELVLWYWTEQQ